MSDPAAIYRLRVELHPFHGIAPMTHARGDGATHARGGISITFRSVGKGVPGDDAFVILPVVKILGPKDLCILLLGGDQDQSVPKI